MTLSSTLINWRRELHQHPELSLQEEATTGAFRPGCTLRMSTFCRSS
jgi:hypothetical protein